MVLLLKIFPQIESGLQLEFVLLICVRTKVNREGHNWQISDSLCMYKHCSLGYHI